MTDRLSNADLRRLFLERHALSDSPAGPLTRDGLDALIQRLGFVQVDTISTLEQAHHHILFTRAGSYRKPLLKYLLEKRRSLFEHWTHDASIIPTRYYPYWKLRFQRRAVRIAESRYWVERFNGRQQEVLDGIRRRVRDGGPVGSRDVTPDDEEERGAWWGWTPSKVALEYLWHTGEFAVTARRGFSKLYDLAERVIPDVHRMPEPTHEEAVDWNCREAIARLGIATHSEIAAFFAAVSPDEAKAWCMAAGPDVLRRIEIEHADGATREVFARPDVLDLARAAPEPPARIRFLSPFDPMIRERDRTQRFFGFDYRFEAFVPAARRVWGYYVLPMLERDRLIGRIELKAHRDRSELEVRGFWLEPGTRPAKARIARVEAEIDRWRRFTGLDRVTWTADDRPGQKLPTS